MDHATSEASSGGMLSIIRRVGGSLLGPRLSALRHEAQEDGRPPLESTGARVGDVPSSDELLEPSEALETGRSGRE
jgi:hypothetical protein